jgi:hypothetical protein
MVSCPKPPPPERTHAADLLNAIRRGPPHCLVCNTQILGARLDSSGELRWCEACKSFQKTYRGPPRQSLCLSCFNAVEGSRSYPIACAALKYQMDDLTWRSRYDQPHIDEYRQMGQEKVRHEVKPDIMKKPQFQCDLYEPLDEGETRETIRVQDPLRFYDRTRFFD